MSLAQFAGRYVASSDSSLTLVFSPGEHTLSQIIHISSIHNVTLIGDSEQLTVIDYVGESGLELTYISSVLFVANLGMRRDRQTVLNVKNALNVFINKCQIVGKNGPQMIQSSAVKIYSALTVSVSKSKFENNQIHYDLLETHIIIQGSALYIGTSHSVIVEESTFTNNSISASNTVKGSHAMGAAMFLLETNITTLINCTVKNNKIRQCHGCRNVYSLGGGIFLSQINQQLTVKNSTFEKNEVFANPSLGGAIFVLKNHGTVGITGSTFLNNSADLGGSININHPASFIFQSSNNIYISNTAFLGGGAIAIASTHMVEIYNDQYTGNKAFRNGAAILAIIDNLKIVDSSYIDNTNGNQDIQTGGTINLIIQDNGSCNISRNTFTGNNASMGGAIQAHHGTNCTCHSFSNIFVNNTALYQGGAVSLTITGSTTTYNSSHDRFVGNFAGGNGGAMYIELIDGEYTSSHSTFQGNTAGTLWGGAINVLNFVQETGSSFNSLHNIFTANTAPLGGAVYIYSLNRQTAKNSIINNTFLNNTAQQGGALSVNKIKLTIVKTYFSNHWVIFEKSMDSVIAGLDSTITVSDSTVTRTAAIDIYFTHFAGSDVKLHKNFGPLRSRNSVLEFNGKCEFIENARTHYNGGAISATQSDIQFKSTAIVEIHGNRAATGRPEDIMLILLPIILFCTSPFCSLLFPTLFPVIPHCANITHTHTHTHIHTTITLYTK